MTSDESADFEAKLSAYRFGDEEIRQRVATYRDDGRIEADLKSVWARASETIVQASIDFIVRPVTVGIRLGLNL